MAVSSKPATCHPDRPHVAHGLCAKCYARSPERLEAVNQWAAENRLARRLAVRASYLKHRDKNLVRLRRNNRARRGISEDEFQRAVVEQGGVCAICRIAAATCADHDHKTGKFRGALCSMCNIALGMMQDKPHVLMWAAAYLMEVDAPPSASNQEAPDYID